MKVAGIALLIVCFAYIIYVIWDDIDSFINNKKQ